MDVLFFLVERTRFIRQFYETATAPFQEIKRKIEAEEEPFVLTARREMDEPPYLQEWLEAETGVQVVGRTCISMLSSSLKLYFQTWEKELGVRWEKGERPRYFKEGFVPGYRRIFGELLKLDWTTCPADLELLEQITLARNAEQHPEHISTIDARHDPKTRVRFPMPFFVTESDRAWLASEEPPTDWFWPSVHVSPEKLLTAVSHVEALGGWLEEHMRAAKYG
ncbi:MAG: hypothetical protein JSS43_18285 [Proteobacteria bacterium]|nr:hypothetical protein [Pseudomonadota bacterium]